MSHISNATSPATSSAARVNTSFPWRAVLIAGLAVGSLDGLEGAVFYFVTAGLVPFQVFRFIASGMLGASAFDGGLLTVALGGTIHYALSFLFAAIFLLAYRTNSTVRQHWISIGLAYGVGVWAFMTFVALPMSAVQPSPFSWLAIANGAIGHALTVGLTSAWIARKYLSR
jgi:hypothetical protein